MKKAIILIVFLLSAVLVSGYIYRYEIPDYDVDKVLDYEDFTENFTSSGTTKPKRLIVNKTNLVVNAVGYENKVGIGTASPSEKLDVAGNVTIFSSQPLEFTQEGVDNVITSVQQHMRFETDRTSDEMKFYPNNTLSFTVTDTEFKVNSNKLQFDEARGFVYNPTLNDLGIVVDGSMDISNSLIFLDSSTNKVGIGTANPTKEFHIIGNTNVSVDLYIGDDLFVADKVGIGTAPLLELDVNGKMVLGVNVTSTRLNSQASGGRAINIIDENAVFRIWRFAGSGAGFEMVNGINDSVDSLDNAWWDIVLEGTGTTSNMLFRSRVGGISHEIMYLKETGGARLTNNAGQDVVHLGVDGGQAGFIQLDESDGSTQTQFRSDGSDSYMKKGNFGIGTSTPQEILDINGGTEEAFVRLSSSDANVGFEFNSTNIGTRWFRMDGNGVNFAIRNKVDTGGQFLVRNNDNDNVLNVFFNAPNNALIIKSTGVGLRTNSPTENLVINGTKTGISFDADTSDGVVYINAFNSSNSSQEVSIRLWNGAENNSNEFFGLCGYDNEGATQGKVCGNIRIDKFGQFAFGSGVGEVTSVTFGSLDFKVGDDAYMQYGGGLDYRFKFDNTNDEFELTHTWQDSIFLVTTPDQDNSNIDFLSGLVLMNETSSLVEISDDLDVGGNFTGNQIYGEMYNYSSHASPYTFDILANDIYYNLTGLVEGNLNGFSFSDGNQTSGGSKLTAQVAGLYKVCSSLSFLSNNVGGTFGIGIVENYDVTLHRDCYSRREAAIQIGNVGVCCLMDLDAGDIVNIQIENEDNTRDMIIHTVNLNLMRIGD